MTVEEIIEEAKKMTPEERAEILQFIAQLEKTGNDSEFGASEEPQNFA